MSGRCPATFKCVRSPDRHMLDAIYDIAARYDPRRSGIERYAERMVRDGVERLEVTVDWTTAGSEELGRDVMGYYVAVTPADGTGDRPDYRRPVGQPIDAREYSGGPQPGLLDGPGHPAKQEAAVVVEEWTDTLTGLGFTVNVDTSGAFE